MIKQQYIIPETAIYNVSVLTTLMGLSSETQISGDGGGGKIDPVGHISRRFFL